MIDPSVPTPDRMMRLIADGVIENAAFVLVVVVVGTESGKKIKIVNAAIFPDLKFISKIFPGATYISYPTSVSAVAFSKILSDNDTFGVFPPEALNPSQRKKVLI